MRISFTHCTNILYIMSHNCIRDWKICCRSIRKMTDNKRSWFTTVFIHYHYISKFICSTCFYKLWINCIKEISTSSNFEAPRLIRCELGIINLISFTNFFKRELGSREVVTHTLGSSIPAVAYSSSTCVYYLRIIKNKIYL